jgi:hypothetical protein
VPAEQCPECGRFLTQAFVAGLAEAAAPCPRCGTELSLDRLAESRTGPEPVGDTSVRPPDLRPDAVRDLDDPVAGWDVGVPVGTAAVRDERPFPTDTVVVAGASLLGALLGALLGRRTVRDAVLGALGGAVGAAAVRRIWQLP